MLDTRTNPRLDNRVGRCQGRRLMSRATAALPLQPARRRQAHHQFRRRQHLGQGDRRTTRSPARRSRCCGSRARAATSARSSSTASPRSTWTSCEALKKLYRGVEHEDEMVGYLPHCTFNLNPRAASIDTPLHGFVPYKHVDHMHPDAIIAIAASKNSKRADAGDLRRRDRLAALAAAGLRARPGAREPSPRRTRRPRASCSKAMASSPGRTTPRTATRRRSTSSTRRSTGSQRRPPARRPSAARSTKSLAAAERRAIAARLMPEIRGLIGEAERKVGHFDDQDAVLEFVNSSRSAARWRRSAPPARTISCAPRSGRWCVDFDPAKPGCRCGRSPASTRRSRPIAPTTPRYYERCKHAEFSPAMRDPNPVVYLVPGVGMITFAKRQGDGAHRRRVLRQRHQRHARRLDGLDISRPARAGSLRHRILGT